MKHLFTQYTNFKNRHALIAQTAGVKVFKSNRVLEFEDDEPLVETFFTIVSFRVVNDQYAFIINTDERTVDTLQELRRTLVAEYSSYDAVELIERINHTQSEEVTA